MEQRDYLKDQIEQMARVLVAMIAKLTGLIEQHESEAVVSTAHQQLKEQLNLEMKELVAMEEKDLYKVITDNKDLEPKLYPQLAKVFELVGDAAYEQKNMSEALSYYHKALQLMELFNQSSNSFSFEFNAHIEDLVLKCKAAEE